MKNLYYFVLMVALVSLIAGCNTGDSNIEIFEIGPEMVDCEAVGPWRCMIVNGGYFYDRIEGFDYEDGYNYVIEVKSEEIENPPADASSIKYTLVKVISKEEA